nr:MAG TPA: Huntingtin protein-like protein [Caudoviricetes sp.]
MTHQAPAPQAPQEPQQPQQGEQLPQQPPSPPQQQVFPQYQPQPQGYAQRPMPATTGSFEGYKVTATVIATFSLVVFALGVFVLFDGNGGEDLIGGMVMTGGSLVIMLLAGIWHAVAAIGHDLAVSRQLRQR